ncbi:hypothetical protein Tco_0054894, partial [Tanacetum coccineum]
MRFLSHEERMGCNFDGAEAQSFNDFIDHVGLIDLPLGVILTSWEANSRAHSPDIQLKNNLKNLRQDIKRWESKKLAEKQGLKDELLKNLKDWDAKAEAGTLNQFEVEKQEKWLMDLSHLDHFHREDVKQKCHLRWVVEGDDNSRYFHSILKYNYAKSSINGINVNGVWVVNPDDIKSATLEHFASRFKENIVCRPKFQRSRFRKLSPPDASFLESLFSINEI